MSKDNPTPEEVAAALAVLAAAEVEREAAKAAPVVVPEPVTVPAAIDSYEARSFKHSATGWG